MPELPEVEVVCRGIAPLVTDRTILAITPSGKKLRSPFPRAGVRRYGIGATVVAVTRRAKYLLLSLDNKALIVIHLGMSGKLRLAPPEEPLRLHDHVRMRLDSGEELRLNDARRFGLFDLLSPAEAVNPKWLRNLGPEPFDEAFSASHLRRMAQGKKTPIKNLLMDNRVVVGIGNIYASESLFDARILPTKPAGQLSLAACKRLVASSRKILRQAIQAGGTTISDFANATGEAGYFQVQLMVYDRAGQPCRACGSAIRKTVLGGRSTFFCPRCQREAG
ncbi:MAG TPA: bifunctional DNA-formamidopyrimidine glycosylase/DNA-(apurinic or apyrimidinic site) lyase [Desulfurivibrionaceae bacterium]|nr:bifunctional DNA-formamidopyrimidine glycosylase/DNA-(apurinic or apyrimidinic site) lyase [Desulfurivibrionaceae bacterium]